MTGNRKSIDDVLSKTMKVMEQNKYDIFEISETAMDEIKLFEKELININQEADVVIQEVDHLEGVYRKSRERLAEVSRDFKRFRESDIKDAYEKVSDAQLELQKQRQQESTLRQRRDKLKRQLKRLDMTVERAEAETSNMRIVVSYLNGDINRMAEELETAKSKQLLGLKMIIAQEDERRRVAREIHDGPAQSMANVVLHSEIAERMMRSADVKEAQTEVSYLKAQVKIALEEVRRIIFDLRPMSLDDLGLVPTMRVFVENFEERSKLGVDFDVEGNERRLQSPVEEALFRIVQECFTNTLKHAKATSVFLQLFYTDEELTITFRDNGQGISPEQLQQILPSEEDEEAVEGEERTASDEPRGEKPKRQHGHFGLMGIQERIEMLGGTFKIQSSSEGTRIEVSLPISELKERRANPR